MNVLTEGSADQHHAHLRCVGALQGIPKKSIMGKSSIQMKRTLELQQTISKNVLSSQEGNDLKEKIKM